MLLLAGLALAGCQRAEHDTATLGGSPRRASRACLSGIFCGQANGT